MSPLMATRAKSYQIPRFVLTEVASPLNVMDLKIFHPPTPLASPTVSLQDFAAKLSICFGLEPQTRPFGADSSQGAAWIASKS
jgi:hypothetical protein